jgi:hypothetical protein
VIFFTWLTLHAQSDSVKFNVSQPEYDFLYQELFNFDPASTFGGLVSDPSFLPQKFTGLNGQPFILNFYRQIPPGTSLLTSQSSLFTPSPFINSFSIQSAASYRLNDKLFLSGNSFSGNSIFNPFPANSDLNNMSIRGTSMFLQYKISKNIHIGGGISVTNH